MYVGLAAWGWKWNVFTSVNKIKFLNLREELQPMELCLFPYKSLWGIFFFFTARSKMASFILRAD